MSLSDKDRDWGVSGLKDRKVLPLGSLSDKIWFHTGQKKEAPDLAKLWADDVRESVRKIKDFINQYKGNYSLSKSKYKIPIINFLDTIKAEIDEEMGEKLS